MDDFTIPLSALRRDRPTWEVAVRKLRNRKMPPRGSPAPNDVDRDVLINWIEQSILAPESESDAAGKFMARRLQRSEYANAIRDLLGVSLHAVSDLPDDDTGWDRYASAPALSPTHREQYRAAAETILEEALADDESGCVASCDKRHFLARTPHSFYFESTGNKDAERAREVLAGLAHKAYRRPIEPVEMDRLVAIFERAGKDGATFEASMRAAVGEVLISPYFLFRIEHSHRAYVAQPALRGSNCSQLELAARLSFFLWSSTPDEELLDLAEKGKLSANLDKQVRRMLKDARTHALGPAFAAHWLSLSKVQGGYNLDEELAAAMRQETEHFLDSIIQQDRSVFEFLDADFTFLNERLAKHYGIAGVQGEAMRRVNLQGTVRGGLVTHASILTLTSDKFETSPVNRGKWVLENLLGSPPIRPTAAALEALKNIPREFDGSMTQNMELHRAHPGCAQCHVKMDVIGLSLENFDADGGWRTTIRHRPVESSGVLPGGEVLNGPADLKAYLLKNRASFVCGLREKLLCYALGRKLNDADRLALNQIPIQLTEGPMPFSRVLMDVMQSEPFQNGWHGVER